MYLYKNETDREYTLLMGIDGTRVVIGTGKEYFGKHVKLILRISS